MKRKILLLVTIIFTSIMASNAQGGFQRLTIEERVKRVHDKMDSAFKLEPAKLANVDSIFTDFYKGQAKVREDMMNGGGQFDREAMMEKMKPLTDDRDAKLKAVLGDDNYKIWKDKIEPDMMPRRPMRQQ